IAVDVLVGRLRGRALERAQIAIWAFSTLLLAYLTYLAVYLIPPMAAQSTPLMGWPQLGSFSAFIVLVAVMAVQAGARSVHCIRRWTRRPRRSWAGRVMAAAAPSTSWSP